MFNHFAGGSKYISFFCGIALGKDFSSLHSLSVANHIIAAFYINNGSLINNIINKQPFSCMFSGFRQTSFSSRFKSK